MATWRPKCCFCATAACKQQMLSWCCISYSLTPGNRGGRNNSSRRYQIRGQGMGYGRQGTSWRGWNGGRRHYFFEGTVQFQTYIGKWNQAVLLCLLSETLSGTDECPCCQHLPCCCQCHACRGHYTHPTKVASESSILLSPLRTP